MSEKIAQFTKPQEAVWECWCGCQQFMLMQNGDVKCAGCKEISQTMGCFEKDKELVS